MTDTELDEMLNEWDTPPVPASLRQRVQAGMTPVPRRSFAGLAVIGWKGLFAGALLASFILLLVVVAAFPQSLGRFSFGFRIPYVVETELVRYADDGSPKVEINLTSFMNGGDQILLTVAISGSSPWQNFVRAIRDPAQMILLQVAPSLVIPPQSSESAARHRALIANGCVRPGDAGIGHETVLGYSTTVVRSDSAAGRTTMWLAPDLGCFDMRHINEERRPDGTFRMTLRIQALKVTVNP